MFIYTVYIHLGGMSSIAKEIINKSGIWCCNPSACWSILHLWTQAGGTQKMHVTGKAAYQENMVQVYLEIFRRDEDRNAEESEHGK